MEVRWSDLIGDLVLDLRPTLTLVDRFEARGDLTGLSDEIWETISAQWIESLESACLPFIRRYEEAFRNSIFEAVSVRPVRSYNEHSTLVELRFTPVFDYLGDLDVVAKPRLETINEMCYPDGLWCTFTAGRSLVPDSEGLQKASASISIDLSGLESHDRFLAFAKFHQAVIQNCFRGLTVDCQHNLGVSDVDFNRHDAVEYLRQYTSSRELAGWDFEDAHADGGFTLTHELAGDDPDESTIGTVRMMAFFDILALYFYGDRQRFKWYFDGLYS